MKMPVRRPHLQAPARSSSAPLPRNALALSKSGATATTRRSRAAAGSEPAACRAKMTSAEPSSAPCITCREHAGLCQAMPTTGRSAWMSTDNVSHTVPQQAALGMR